MIAVASASANDGFVQSLSQLHPVAQCVAVIMIGLVAIAFIWSMSKLI
jgi:hypothetical protein